jgi:aldose 1-epimerase
VRDNRYLLGSPSGVCALLSTRGAGLVALRAPDRDGRFADIVLGFDTADEYAANADTYFGVTVGRVANRIGGARFQLGDSTYALAANDGRNHLHGGVDRSFDRVDWEAQSSSKADGPSVEFRHVSPHMEEGYPGRVETVVTYTLTPRDELRVDYRATTDAPTPFGLTNHTYWNLSGDPSRTVLDHELEIDADAYTPVDGELIPTGAIEPVEGTPFDFRTPRRIGDRIDAIDNPAAGGYDHNLVLTPRQAAPTFAARLVDPSGGRCVEVLATHPCVQFYTGNSLGSVRGKLGAGYAWRSGLCLEPQAFPDAINKPAFPSVVLNPGETYRSTIVFRITTR